MPERKGKITGHRDGVPVIDGGDAVVQTIGAWVSQTGTTDADYVNFLPGDEAWVTKPHAHHLDFGGAVIIKELPVEEAMAKKPPKKRAKKPRKKVTKAMRPKEDK